MNAGDEIFDVVMGIDWNQAWQTGRARTQHRWDGRTFWNGRAASFATHARESGYCNDVLAILQPSPDWTVLDIGCGAGTLAIPLASISKITGVPLTIYGSSMSGISSISIITVSTQLEKSLLNRWTFGRVSTQ